MATPKADPAAIYRQNIREARILATKTGDKRLRTLLEKAQGDLSKRLHQAEGLGGPGSDSFTATRLRLTMMQVDAVVADLKLGMRGVVVKQGTEAAELSASGAVEYMKRAEAKYRGISAASALPIKEASMVDRVVQGTEASVLRRLLSTPGEPAALGILDRYGVSTVSSFEDVAQLALATGQTWDEVRAQVVARSMFLQEAPAYWAERIVRTETVAAYNRAGFESVREADSQLGDMVKILSATFDSRTSWDSIAVHGQIRRPEEPFECFTAGGGTRLYMHPPNRPNDREVVVPQRISWPIPDYLQPLGDGDYQARFMQERPKGSPPGRPKMSTVDRELFGKQSPPGMGGGGMLESLWQATVTPA